MKNIIIEIVNYLKIVKRHYKYVHHFKKLMRMQNIPNIKAYGEDEYLKYWKQLTPLVEPYSYRLFRHYCGNTRYIVPEDIGHSYIEPKLNPTRFTSFYEDKNILPLFLPEGSVPRTRLCRIHGSEILDSNNVPCVHIREMSAEYVYSILGGNKVILKPSIDSNS